MCFANRILEAAVNKVYIVIGFSLLVTGSANAAEADFSGYAYYREIETPEANRDQLVALTLNREVYANCRLDYADVRVVRDGESEVPRLIRRRVKTKEATVDKEHSARIANLLKDDKNRIDLVVRAPKNTERITGLVVKTPLRNYERSVNVYGRTADSDSWQVLASDKMLYDYSRFADVRHNKIYFAPGNYRELKIEINEVTGTQTSRLMKLQETFAGEKVRERTETQTLERRPFRVDSVAVITQQKREKITDNVINTYAAKSVRFEVDHKGANTAVIDTFRQPLTRLQIATPTHNFSRPALVKVSEPEPAQVIARDDLYDLSYEDLNDQDLRIEWSETRAARLTLKIRNADNPPLEITGVKLQGNVYEVVFLARPGGVYSLYYGREASDRPRYDQTAIKRLLDKGFTPHPGQLKTHQKNPTYSPSTRSLLNSKIFFITVIAVMVAGLALALYSAAKHS